MMLAARAHARVLFSERLRRTALPVRNTRKVRKADMILNDAQPAVDVDPETLCIDPAAFERANYITVLDSYTHPTGVLR